MTDKELKQRCLELGYDEERIDDIIKETNNWSVLRGKYSDDYFGRLFESKCDDEKALREVIDNWDSLLLHYAIKEDKVKHPDDYKLEEVDHDNSINIDELDICDGFRHGFTLKDEKDFRKKFNKKWKKIKEKKKRTHRMLKSKRKKRRRRN